MTSRTAAQTTDDRLGRYVAEYREMPGLSLTPPQAARLWGIETGYASRILEQLTSYGLLTRTAGGSYVLRRD